MLTKPVIRYKLFAFALGFSCFIVQLVLLREFLNLFMGNELVIGLMLALWMLATALGAYSGRLPLNIFKHAHLPAILLVLLAVSPLAGAFLAPFLKLVFFEAGEMLPLSAIVMICLSGVGIFCFLSGVAYSVFAGTYAAWKGNNGISAIYAVEALGSLTGGLLFNLVLAGQAGNMQILFWLGSANLLLAAWAAFSVNVRLQGYLYIAAGMIAGMLSLFSDPGLTLSRLQYPGQNVLLVEDTPSGRMILIERSGQYTLFRYGEALMSSDDVMQREEKVHYPMALHPGPQNVLMIYGGMDGSADEVRKYGNVNLYYADPEFLWIKEAVTYQNNEALSSAVIATDDPRRYLARTEDRFDAIISNAGAPTTIGNNRLYTDYFFRVAHERLKEGGILSVHLPAAGNYLDHELRSMYSTVYNAMSQVFEYIRIIPGGSTYFLASDHPIEGHITERIRKLDIQTAYVNQWYINDTLLEARARKLEGEIDRETLPNTDNKAIAARTSISRWLGMFHLPVWIMALLPLLLLLVMPVILRPVNGGLFITGFTASSAEFILLVAFQLAYGFLYQMAGFVIMSFMAGLALGAGFLFRYFSAGKISFMAMQAVLGTIMLLFPLISGTLNESALFSWIPGLAICFITLLVAIAGGIQYRLATILCTGSGEEVAATTYGADLTGSAIGIFLTAAVIYPIAGMMMTCVLLALMNFLMLAYLYWRMK